MLGRAREVRQIAGVTISKAAQVAGTSYTQMFYAETGLRRLKPEQAMRLEVFYVQRIGERLRQLSVFLGGSGG